MLFQASDGDQLGMKFQPEQLQMHYTTTKFLWMFYVGLLSTFKKEDSLKPTKVGFNKQYNPYFKGFYFSSKISSFKCQIPPR